MLYIASDLMAHRSRLCLVLHAWTDLLRIRTPLWTCSSHNVLKQLIIIQIEKLSEFMESKAHYLIHIKSLIWHCRGPVESVPPYLYVKFVEDLLWYHTFISKFDSSFDVIFLQNCVRQCSLYFYHESYTMYVPALLTFELITVIILS